MEILVRIAQVFLSFTILVGIHEFGHFIAARIFKIRVEKFFIFFDPWFHLFKFKRGDTEYGMGWLPLGGYVKIAGMIDESVDLKQMEQPVQEDEFRAKAAWKRFIVMIAGVVMNVLMAVLIYSGVCYTWGDSYFSNQDAQWGYNYNETAHGLGFVDGDKIISIDGEVIDDQNDIRMMLILTGEDRSVVVERNGVNQTIEIPLEALIAMRKEQKFDDLYTLRMPFIVDSIVNPNTPLLKGDQLISINGVEGNDASQMMDQLKTLASTNVELKLLRAQDTVVINSELSSEGTLGVMLANPFEMRTRHYTLLESIPAGVKRAGGMISSYIDQLKLIAQPDTEMYKEVGGFISIAKIFPSTWNWLDFWMKTAFLSIILAVMNILPIPGLDGGHALFTFWEMVTRRKPSDKFMEYTQYVGLVIIMALLLYANGSDIIKLFQ